MTSSSGGDCSVAQIDHECLYVTCRCVKSNEHKVADKFHTEFVLQQLRSSGVLDIARVRQMALPVRMDFGEFVDR